MSAVHPIRMALLNGILWSAASVLAARTHTFSFQFSWAMTQAVMALVAGVLVLIRPKNLNFILAAYLILLGALGLVQIYF